MRSRGHDGAGEGLNTVDIPLLRLGSLRHITIAHDTRIVRQPAIVTTTTSERQTMSPSSYTVTAVRIGATLPMRRRQLLTRFGV